MDLNPGNKQVKHVSFPAHVAPNAHTNFKKKTEENTSMHKQN